MCGKGTLFKRTGCPADEARAVSEQCLWRLSTGCVVSETQIGEFPETENAQI